MFNLFTSGNENIKTGHEAQNSSCLQNLKIHRSAEVSRRERSGLFQQFRFKNRANQYPIEWRNTTVQQLSHIIDKQENFFLSRDYDWRKWNSVMQQILRKIQNYMVKDSQMLSGFAQIPNFQESIELMCGLNSPHFQAHLLMFISTILKFNHIYRLFNQPQLSENLLRISKNNANLTDKVYWELAGIHNTLNCVMKVLDSDSLYLELLPVCTILANFVVYAQLYQIQQVLNHSRLENMTVNILNNPDSTYETVRQLHLFYNNLLSKSPETFQYVTSKGQIIQQLLKRDNQQTWVTVWILLKAQTQGYQSTVNLLFLQNRASYLKTSCPTYLSQLFSTLRL